MIEVRSPDIVVIYKRERASIVVAADRIVEEKEREKVEKYQDLKRETGRMWRIRKVQVVPVVIGALRNVTKGCDKLIEKA